MRYTAILEQLGLSKSEIQVYTTLLELDSSSVIEISKRADINRTSCYDVLNNLIKKGLASKFRKKKKIFFSAMNPRRLLSYLEREKEEYDKQIQKKQEQIKDILPELASLVNPKGTHPRVSLYEGDKGMREAYEDTLQAKDGILSYANVETVNKALPNFFPDYYKRRAKLTIPIKAIFENNQNGRDRAALDCKELRESIVLADRAIHFTPEINIYNDKMLIASWKEKMAVIIESKELADLQRIIFKIAWDALKKQT